MQCKNVKELGSVTDGPIEPNILSSGVVYAWTYKRLIDILITESLPEKLFLLEK